MSDYKLVIFDWDGTLMDSVARIVSSMQASAAKYNFDVPSAEAVKGIIGLSLPKSVHGLFTIESLAMENALIDEYKEQYSKTNKTPTQLFPGSMALLESLKAQGTILAVATGKGRSGLERVWLETKTGHFFNASRCSDEVKSKPDPEMITSLLAELSIDAKDAVMIGDTGFDLGMANNAGVDCVGVTFGVASAQQLEQYKPVAIVDSITQLTQLLTNKH